MPEHQHVMSWKEMNYWYTMHKKGVWTHTHTHKFSHTHFQTVKLVEYVFHKLPSGNKPSEGGCILRILISCLRMSRFQSYTSTTNKDQAQGRVVNPWIELFYVWRTCERWSLLPLSPQISTWLTAACQNTRAVSWKPQAEVCMCGLENSTSLSTATHNHMMRKRGKLLALCCSCFEMRTINELHRSVCTLIQFPSGTILLF